MEILMLIFVFLSDIKKRFSFNQILSWKSSGTKWDKMGQKTNSRQKITKWHKVAQLDKAA
jgi:hypothetical protein